MDLNTPGGVAVTPTCSTPGTARSLGGLNLNRALNRLVRLQFTRNEIESLWQMVSRAGASTTAKIMEKLYGTGRDGLWQLLFTLEGTAEDEFLEWLEPFFEDATIDSEGPAPNPLQPLPLPPAPVTPQQRPRIGRAPTSTTTGQTRPRSASPPPPSHSTDPTTGSSNKRRKTAGKTPSKSVAAKTTGGKTTGGKTTVRPTPVHTRPQRYCPECSHPWKNAFPKHFNVHLQHLLGVDPDNDEDDDGLISCGYCGIGDPETDQSNTYLGTKAFVQHVETVHTHVKGRLTWSFNASMHNILQDHSRQFRRAFSDLKRRMDSEGKEKNPNYTSLQLNWTPDTKTKQLLQELQHLGGSWAPTPYRNLEVEDQKKVKELVRQAYDLAGKRLTSPKPPREVPPTPPAPPPSQDLRGIEGGRDPDLYPDVSNDPEPPRMTDMDFTSVPPVPGQVKRRQRAPLNRTSAPTVQGLNPRNMAYPSAIPVPARTSSSQTQRQPEKHTTSDSTLQLSGYSATPYMSGQQHAPHQINTNYSMPGQQRTSQLQVPRQLQRGPLGVTTLSQQPQRLSPSASSVPAPSTASSVQQPTLNPTIQDQIRVHPQSPHHQPVIASPDHIPFSQAPSYPMTPGMVDYSNPVAMSANPYAQQHNISHGQAQDSPSNLRMSMPSDPRQTPHSHQVVTQAELPDVQEQTSPEDPMDDPNVMDDILNSTLGPDGSAMSTAFSEVPSPLWSAQPNENVFDLYTHMSPEPGQQ